MKRHMIWILAVVLSLCLLLSGCGLLGLFGGNLVSYRDMEYVRPDMTAFASVLEESCKIAQESENIKTVENAIWDFYDVFDRFYTSYSLSMISYFRNLNDSYWSQEYAYCAGQTAVADAGLDRLYRSLAKSPIRDTLEGEDYFGPDYFDSYEGESIYDEEMTRMLTEEAALQNEYQALCGDAAEAEYYSEEFFDRYGREMAEVFLQLVRLRQDMAAYAGYDSYPEFAYDFYYARDYTPQQAVSYLADIRAELVELYRRQKAGEDITYLPASEQSTLHYVQSMASAMGGTAAQAFRDMKSAGVYDLAHSPNKYGASFEIYLPTYYTPYIFLSPTGSNYDYLSFAHEFGHFCCDYVMPGGSYQGVDVAEVFSQGMEYLSLFYADGGDEMLQMKLEGCLGVYVEQAAYASFEHQVYGLTGDALTVEGIEALYEEIGIGYGLDSGLWDSRDYVCIPHFYDSPMYIISYVLSNDAAFQIYEMELAQEGQGLACLQENMSSTEAYFLAFLGEAGLTSPFEAGRLQQVKKSLESALH